MAISVSNLTTGSSTSADPSTASVTPTAGAHVLVWVGASYSSGEVPDNLTVSGGSATWAKISTGVWRERRRGWLYIGSGWSGGSDTVDFTFSGTDPQEFAWSVDEATGLNSTTPYRGLGHNYHDVDAVTSWTVTATATALTGEVTYACCQLENNQTALAAAGYTELGAEAGGTLGVRRLETAYDSDADEDAAWTWGGSSQGFGGVTIILCDTDTSGLFRLVQAAGGDAPTSDLEATFEATPTEGNLLIAVLLERGSTNPPTGDSMTTSGYTDAGYQRVQGSSPTYRRGMAVYYKFAGSSESTLVAGTYNPAASNSRIMIAEFANVGSYNDIVWADNGATADGTTLTSSSQSTSGASCLIALVAYKMKIGDPETEPSIKIAFTNDFVHTFKNRGASNSFVAGIGQVEKASSGSYSTQSTLSATSTKNSGIHLALLDFDSSADAQATDSPAVMGASF